MRKDKEKVLDEVWTEDHVRSFLDFRPYDGSDPDFHALLKAYQSMRESACARFAQLFGEQLRDLNARGRDGRSVLDVVEQHRHGAPDAKILRDAGAH